MRGIQYLYILIFLCNICLFSTQDYNNDDYNSYNYYEEYVYDHDCGWTEHFCPSTNISKNASEVCDGKCGSGYHFCHGSCLHDSEACDGQCGIPDQQRFCSFNDLCLTPFEACDEQCIEGYHFCPWVASLFKEHMCNGNISEYHRYCAFPINCLPNSDPCDGNCPEGYPNLCDNGTVCYPNSSINNGVYDCDDKSDEYRPTGEPCGGFYRFCPSNGSCLHHSEPCDGQCGKGYHFCPSTYTCIDVLIPCDGNCPDNYPNLCDNANGPFCYSNTYINNREYDCLDRSDEHRPTEEPPPLDNSSVDKFLQLNSGVGEFGWPGVDCQDGTVYEYLYWCKEEHSRMCGNVSTIDYFICHNLSLWNDRPCPKEHIRGCKVPGKCISEHKDKCNGHVGRSTFECGASDYSDETCSVNEGNIKEYTRYFRCNDNSSLIHPTLVCDGFIHCGDSSDENECDHCPRINNTAVYNQVVRLKAEEIRYLAHLKVTAIMKCMSPYGQPICATPGDGIAECAWELKEGLWQTQDEVELTTSTLWQTIFKYMSYIFLMSVVILKITQQGYLCKKSTDGIPILTSYRKTTSLDSEPLPLSISTNSFPTPLFTTTEPMQLTHQFKQYYIRNHRLERFEEFFNFCLTSSQFLPTRMESDIIHCGIYALEAQIHNMSPTCADRCLKQHSSSSLEQMFNSVYGSFSDIFPNGIKNAIFEKDKLLCLNYLLRIKTFLFRFFFFYYDIVQEYVLLSFILGTTGLGVSTATWLRISDFDYIHMMVYLYIISVFLPILLFGIQLSFSSQIGMLFGVEKPSVRQNVWFRVCCFILFPFIPTVLFFRIEKQKMKMITVANKTSKILSRQRYQNNKYLSLDNEILEGSKILMDINTDITKAKSLYKQFKEWELAIELPIQSSLTIIFSFMRKSTTVVNQAFQKWFISDTKSLILLIGMSLRSIIAVQISDESSRRNNFLGIKSKMLLAPLYMLTSIPRILAIVIYAAVPLGLMDLLGHWTVEIQGLVYRYNGFNIYLSNDSDCITYIGNNVTEDARYYTKDGGYYSSTLFSADVSYTKYTVWKTSTYMAILLALLATSVTINFVWVCFGNKKSLSQKILFSSKSLLSITLESDFDEDDKSVRPDELQLHYKEKFSLVHKEYVLKLLLHTGTNMTLTFPWALVYLSANQRHQVLMEIGDCLGVKGTVEMEDISLERLWWGHWVLPLVMAVIGVLNYGWFRLYLKYGHPWRRLLISDNERIEEWKKLKLWEILENNNDN